MNPTELLDQLDAARESAAVGRLRVGEHYGIHLYAGENPVGTTLRAADAALIVAAVNYLGPLVTIARELWDEHGGRTCHDRTGGSFHGDELCATRAFITAAFTDGTPA